MVSIGIVIDDGYSIIRVWLDGALQPCPWPSVIVLDAEGINPIGPRNQPCPKGIFDMSDKALVENLALVWNSIAQLCQGFAEDDWKQSTDCPGWSVQDHLSHIVGSESALLGRQTPDHRPGHKEHVKNEVGANNEVVVDWRRPRPGSQVLDEFREVTEKRLAILRTSGADYFETPTETPIGLRDMREFIRIRIFDCWVHEQDIRRAVVRPGHLEGPAAEHCMGRLAMAMPFIVGKKAQAPDGSSVIFDVTGEAGRVLAIGVDGKRAKELAEAPSSPTVRLQMDVETFSCLGCGRWEPSDVLSAGKVMVDGDKALGETVLSQMNFMI